MKRPVMPKWIARGIPNAVREPLRGTTRIDTEGLVSLEHLQDLMLNYQTKNLAGIEPAAFRRRIESYLQLEDYEMEGFQDPQKQRDLSIKFHWGHDHDFGDFAVKGRLGNRHVTLIAILLDWFKELPPSLHGLRVLDIGCWSGGTSLLLCAMGAHVVAVEEVKKYIDCLAYIKEAFKLDRLDPRNLSLYECTEADLQDSFDIVLFAGVLYHVTDPIVALRIAYNCLKDGGKCIVETAVVRSRRRILGYEGPSRTHEGSVGDLSRSGWNWFAPSPPTLATMMADVGFTSVRLSKVVASSAGPRIFAAGLRDNHTDIMRGGLSVRRIR